MTIMYFEISEIKTLKSYQKLLSLVFFISSFKSSQLGFKTNRNFKKLYTIFSPVYLQNIMQYFQKPDKYLKAELIAGFFQSFKDYRGVTRYSELQRLEETINPYYNVLIESNLQKYLCVWILLELFSISFLFYFLITGDVTF